MIDQVKISKGEGVIIMKKRVFRQTLSAIFSVVLLLSCSTGYAENIDPNDDDSQYAWAENVGWLNFEPLGDGGPGVEVGDATLTGYIWGENVGWISLSCENTGSCDVVDYGVANDGCGNLSGFSWGENIGWLNFSPIEGGVTIDPSTGEFSGYAWGENIGWVNFVPAEIPVKTSWRGKGTIRGHVTDRAGNPIPWALVIASLGETKQGDFTDDEGNYDIAGLEPDTYRVVCVKKGYRMGISQAEASACQETVVDFFLKPKAE